MHKAASRVKLLECLMNLKEGYSKMTDEHIPNLKTAEELELDFSAYFRSVNIDKNISPDVCLSYVSDTDFQKIPAGQDIYGPPVNRDHKVILN